MDENTKNAFSFYVCPCLRSRMDATKLSTVFSVTNSKHGALLPPCANVRRDNRSRKRFFSTLIYLASVLILLLSAMACLLGLHRNLKIMEKNIGILETQIKLQNMFLDKIYIDDDSVPEDDYDGFSNNPINPIYFFDIPNSNSDFDTKLANLGPSSRIRRMIKANECPPCPTQPTPNPIEPHRNPVSVLNEEFPNLANYTLLYLCEDPHIHHATLSINDHSLEGYSWDGKGRNMQNAKQAAAWKCIQEDFPELIEKVADEYKPPLYDPLCEQPPTP